VQPRQATIPQQDALRQKRPGSAVNVGFGHVSVPQEMGIPFDQVLDWRIDAQTEPLRSKPLAILCHRGYSLLNSPMRRDYSANVVCVCRAIARSIRNAPIGNG
jgi:hypothetical protein